ncbi:MAG: hypothetical protein LPK25_13700 [Cyclobacteriaceae bacterium]|nr:hypothetical protein [Cyclobacteriaceae bacterium]
MEIFLYGSLIATLSILLIGFPFFYHGWKSKQSEKYSTKNFKEFVESEQLHLDFQESWRNHYTLALDTKKNVLVYARLGEYPTIAKVDLDEVDHLRLDAHYKTIFHSKKEVKKLDYLDLVFYFKDSKRLPKSIPIFDEQEVPFKADELDIANSWMKNIFSRLKPGSGHAAPWTLSS